MRGGTGTYVVSEEKVFWFDVTMDHVFCVAVLQRLRHFEDILRCF